MYFLCCFEMPHIVLMLIHSPFLFQKPSVALTHICMCCFWLKHTHTESIKLLMNFITEARDASKGKGLMGHWLVSRKESCSVCGNSMAGGVGTSASRV